MGAAIKVAFQKKDLPLYTTSTFASASSTIASSSTKAPHPQPSVTRAPATSTLLAPPRTPTPVANNANGLSTGAKAGIVIGSVSIGALLLGAILFLLRRRRRRRRAHLDEHRDFQVPTNSNETANSYHDDANNCPTELRGGVHELDSIPRTELPSFVEGSTAEMES